MPGNEAIYWQWQEGRNHRKQKAKMPHSMMEGVSCHTTDFLFYPWYPVLSVVEKI
jgi:hypothetical protein